MSDFLSNLVTRSFAAAPAIQPRLPSIFEPAKPHVESFSEALPGREEEAHDAETKPVFAPASRPAQPGEERTPGFAPVANTSASLEMEIPLPAAQQFPAAKPNPALPTTGAVPTLDKFVTQAKNEVRRESAPAAFEREIKPQEHRGPSQSSSQPGHLPSEVRTPARTPAHAALEKEVRTADPKIPPASPSGAITGPVQSAPQNPPIKNDAAERTPRSAQPAANGAPLSQPADPSSTPGAYLRGQRKDIVPPRAPAPDPVATRRFEFAHRVPPASRASLPEPTIHVTIGRIEVRADSTQAKAAKQRPPSPVMNLKDYLQSRRGSA